MSSGRLKERVLYRAQVPQVNGIWKLYPSSSVHPINNVPWSGIQHGTKTPDLIVLVISHNYEQELLDTYGINRSMLLRYRVSHAQSGFKLIFCIRRYKIARIRVRVANYIPKHHQWSEKKGSRTWLLTHLSVTPQVKECIKTGCLLDIVRYIIDLRSFKWTMTRIPVRTRVGRFGRWYFGLLSILTFLLFLLVYCEVVGLCCTE